MVKISEIIQEIKDEVMLSIHNKPIDISLEELKTHNKNKTIKNGNRI